MNNLDDYVEDITELLTPTGWKFKSEITEQDTVVQWLENGTMEFVNPTYISSTVFPSTIKVSNHQNHINQVITPKQNLLYEQGGVLHMARALDLEKIRNRNTSNCINAGVLAEEGVGLSVRERILVAIQADGSFNSPSKRTGERIGAVPACFTFAKERKSERLISLATEAGLRLDDRKIDKRGRQNWALYIPSSDQNIWPRDKKLPSIANLNTVSLKWCQEFIEEISLWDGHLNRENSNRIVWKCIDGDNANYVQMVASLAGYRTHFAKKQDHRSEKYSDVYNVLITRHRNSTSIQSVKAEVFNVPTRLYKVDVPSGYVLVRREGAVSIATTF